MGSVSSCTSNCLELSTRPINTIDCNCLCIPHLINMYKTLFQSRGHEPIPSLSLTEASSLSTPTMNTFTSPPIPLPYNDPIFRRTSRQLPAEEDETEPLREGNSSSLESDKWGPVCYTSYDLKGNNCKGNNKGNDCKGKEGEYWFGSADDEDVCPTCLDEYTEDNPRIVTQCSHDFHLGCIYEWMERSEACPVCGKKMVFNESN